MKISRTQPPVDQRQAEREQDLKTFYAKQMNHLLMASEAMNRAIVPMCTEVSLITLAHCGRIDQAFRDFCQAIKTCLDAFSESQLRTERRLSGQVVKLSVLHRMALEASVLISNVRGQCQHGRLHTDPTGAYGHLRMHIRDVMVVYRGVATGLERQQARFCGQYEAVTA